MFYENLVLTGTDLVPDRGSEIGDGDGIGKVTTAGTTVVMTTDGEIGGGLSPGPGLLGVMRDVQAVGLGVAGGRRNHLSLWCPAVTVAGSQV